LNSGKHSSGELNIIQNFAAAGKSRKKLIFGGAMHTVRPRI
jgi:hypothetical protein